MTHEDYKEMLSLDALLGAPGGGDDDRAAREALRGHLEACAECRAVRAEFEDVAAQLAHMVAPVEPPAELRARVLARVREMAAAGGDDESTLDVDDGGEPRVAVSSKVLPFERTTAGRGGGKNEAGLLSKSAFRFGAIAASLVIVALAVALAVLWKRNGEMRDELARVSARADETQRTLAGEQEALRREREALAALTAPDARLATLAGMEPSPRAHGLVSYDPRTGRTQILARALPPAPAGKAYQLWFIAGANPPMPGKVFTTDAKGDAAMSDQAPANLPAATVFAVTLEPAQGVSAPTGSIYLKGGVS